MIRNSLSFGVLLFVILGLWFVPLGVSGSVVVPSNGNPRLLVDLDLTSIPYAESWVTWSPNGNISLSVLNEGIYTINATTGAYSLFLNWENMSSRCTWSADRQWMTFASMDHVYVAQGDGSNPQKVANGSLAVISPNGTKIAYYSTPGELHIIDRVSLVDNFAFNMSSVGQSNYAEVDWSPDSTRFLLSRDGISGENVTIVDCDGTGATLLAPNTLYVREQRFGARWVTNTQLIYSILPYVETQPSHFYYSFYGILGLDDTGTNRHVMYAGTSISPLKVAPSPDGTQVCFLDWYENKLYVLDLGIPVPSADFDGDMVYDADEYWYGTLAMNPDTDSDGLSDGVELRTGFNPANADSDADGISDGIEFAINFNDATPTALPMGFIRLTLNWENYSMIVTTNSTILSILFVSSAQELSFGVSGETGTTGICNATIPLALVDDISTIQVLLDDAPVIFESMVVGEMVQLTFNYTQSTHTIVVTLAGQPTSPPPGPPIPGFPIAAIGLGLFLTLTIGILIRKRWSHEEG